VRGMIVLVLVLVEEEEEEASRRANSLVNRMLACLELP
jgi:hypothetical protein